MTTRVSYGSIAEMPGALQDFLFSQGFADADGKLQQAHRLTDEQRALVGDKIMDAIFNDITLAQAVADLKAAIVPNPVPEDKWPAFLADFLRLEAWPLRELFGDELTKLLAENRVSPAGWPAFRVFLKPLTYGGAASEIANAVGITASGGQIRERLRDLIRSKAKGVRIDAQVKEVLTRQADFGGVGLDPAVADKTIVAMNALLGSVRVMSEEEYADYLAEESQKSQVASRTSSVAQSEATHDARLSTPEEAEIEAIKAKNAAVPRMAATVLDQAVEAVYSTIAEKPADEYLANRLRHIISSRLRDVRNDIELRQLLERDAKVGGLGMAKDAAAALSGYIEEGYKTFHDQIMTEEKRKLEEQTEDQKRKIEDRKKREAEEHAQWYKEKILARTQTEDAQKQLAERMRESLAHPMDAREKRAETEKFGELVPAPAVQADAGPVIKVSKATAEMAAIPTSMKPKMEDVKVAGPRLTGPIQEIKSLNLGEFRRLAKEPEKAAEKILQKIETLGQESFERRAEGIKAWQESALQGAYMSLVAESFRSGTAVAALSEEKRAKGEDVPSPAELSAVISLNSKLHF